MGRAVQCRKPSASGKTGAQGREQWSQGKGAQSESKVRQRSEVRGREECRHTGIDIGRGRDRDRSQGTALRCTDVFHRVGGVDHRSSSTRLQERDRQTDRHT